MLLLIIRRYLSKFLFRSVSIMSRKKPSEDEKHGWEEWRDMFYLLCTMKRIKFKLLVNEKPTSLQGSRWGARKGAIIAQMGIILLFYGGVGRFSCERSCVRGGFFLHWFVWIIFPHVQHIFYRNSSTPSTKIVIDYLIEKQFFCFIYINIFI